MKAVWCICALLACMEISSATPPAQVGFMTGPDSAIFVCWVHPDIHCYESGNDTATVELDFFPGDEPGTFATAARMEFPPVTWLQSFSVKVNQGDLHPELPGDQYSPFIYAVYPDDHDTCPYPNPLLYGSNALCDGIPCAEEWAENDIFLPNPAGDDLWVAFQWSDSTPSAPQLKCRTAVPDGSQSVFGVHDGEKFHWSPLNYTMISRASILAMTEISPVQSPGWRSVTSDNPPPDAFIVRSFFAGMVAESTVISQTDTLIHELSARDVDSAHIQSMYKGIQADEPASAVFSEERILPLITEVIPTGYHTPEFAAMELLMTNLGDEPLILAAGFSDDAVSDSADELKVACHETARFSFRLLFSSSDTGRAVIVLQDVKRQYYPRIISVFYPDSGHTDAGDTGERDIPRHVDLRLYPNPCTGAVRITAVGAHPRSPVNIYNILGQRIVSLRVSPDAETHWDIRGVPPGIYFARMRTGGECITRRLLVLRR